MTDKMRFFSDYKIYKIGNRLTGNIKTLYVPINKLEASKSRFCRKCLNSSDKFDYFVTLTFAENTGNYQIEGWTFNASENLHSVMKLGISKYMRKFMNKLQIYSKRKNNKSLTYAYCYEQGEQNNRPHYHMLIGSPGLDPEKTRRFLQDTWKAGNVDLEVMENDKHKVYNYLSAYLNKEKTFKYDKFNGKRFWNTSRDILPIKPNPDFQFIGICNTSNMAKMMDNFITHDLENFRFQIDRNLLSETIMKDKIERKRISYNNINWTKFPYEIMYDYQDDKCFHPADLVYLKPDVIDPYEKFS